MKLEPETTRAIRRSRNRGRLSRWAVLGTLAVLIVLILVLIIVPYAAGDRSFSPLVRAGVGSAMMYVGLAFLVLLLVGLASFYLPVLIKDSAAFRSLTAGTARFDITRLGRFMNALEDASEAAGVAAPTVKVIRGAQPNALSFEADGGVAIGITAGALDADLTYEQVSAVTAHELGVVLAGGYLRRPGAFTLDSITTWLFGVYTALAVVAIPLTAGGGRVPVAIAVGMVLWVLLLALVFVNRRHRAGRGHDDILADSVAVRLTGDPLPLMEAIRKLDSLVNGVKRSPLPENNLGLDFMFMPPYRWSETPEEFLRRKRDELGFKWSDGSLSRRAEGMEKNLEEVSAWGRGLVAERIANLEEIREGRWTAFGVETRD